MRWADYKEINRRWPKKYVLRGFKCVDDKSLREDNEDLWKHTKMSLVL